jgi:alpha-ketoglutarate-dependent taurine dioxygenase
MIKYHETYINEEPLPIVWEITQGKAQDITYVCDWLKANKPSIDEVINTHGALLIRGLKAINTANAFQQAISSISPELMDYVGGTSPRDQVYGKIMTATNIPAAWSIPLHQEMSYQKNSPERIAFLCMNSAEKGGNSTLASMRHVTNKISATVMNKFRRHGLQLCRTLPSTETLHTKPGIQKSWNEVFSTNDRGKVDEVAKNKGWQTEWLNSQTLKIWQEVLPATKVHTHTNAEVWFNQVHMFSPIGSELWAKRDGRLDDYEKLHQARKQNPEMLDNIFYGNGEVVDEADATYIFELLEKTEIHTKLEDSDLLILDNTLVAHGRSPFVGKREILVALIGHKE